MGKSKKKKQQQLAAKRGKKIIKRKLTLSRRKPGYAAESFAKLSNYPIQESLISDDFFDKEIGLCTALLSRKLPDGDITVAVFMIDIFCLGVKNADARIFTPPEYREYFNMLSEHQVFVQFEPACIVKLVKESVEYAKDLGLAPHKDYRKAQKLFGDIDPAECTIDFEFGRDGKPFYVSGPYDSPMRIRKIINQLTKRFGPEGFHFIRALDPHDPGEEDEN